MVGLRLLRFIPYAYPCTYPCTLGPVNVLATDLCRTAPCPAQAPCCPATRDRMMPPAYRETPPFTAAGAYL